MKRVIMLAGVFCVLFVVGCGGGGSPSSAARKFFDALVKNDVKAMEAVATPETVQLIAMFGEKASGMAAAHGKITKTTEKIDGDTAVVTVTYEDGETEDVDLVKVDGKWKVTIDMGK